MDNINDLELSRFKSDLRFTSLPDYVNSLKDITGMDNEESEMMFWILDMWNKKRFIPPTYELM